MWIVCCVAGIFFLTLVLLLCFLPIARLTIYLFALVSKRNSAARLALKSSGARLVPKCVKCVLVALTAAVGRTILILVLLTTVPVLVPWVTTVKRTTIWARPQLTTIDTVHPVTWAPISTMKALLCQVNVRRASLTTASTRVSSAKSTAVARSVKATA